MERSTTTTKQSPLGGQDYSSVLSSKPSNPIRILVCSGLTAWKHPFACLGRLLRLEPSELFRGLVLTLNGLMACWFVCDENLVLLAAVGLHMRCEIVQSAIGLG